MKTLLYISLGILLMFLPKIIFGQGIFISGGSVTQIGGSTTLLGNWTNNGSYIPTDGTVVFAGTAQTISGTAFVDTFNNVTINSGAALTLAANNNMSVRGTLTGVDSSSLVLQSTIDGTASLMQTTANVKATAQRYMPLNKWHIASSAVAGQHIQGFKLNAANNVPTNPSGNYGIMYYSESGGGWVYYTDPASGDFIAGKGYSLRHTTNSAVSFYGTLASASTNIAITKAGNGWNCIGNPFPCSIGVSAQAATSANFLTTNMSLFDASFAALYLWDEAVPKVSGVDYYKIICNSGFVSTTSKPVLNQAYIQPGQGFIMKSKAGGGTVSFTTDMRLHENTASYFKTAKVSWPGLNLIVSNASKSASTVVTAHENMTRGLDITYDAGQNGGDPNFKLYTRLVEDNGVNFAIQCLPIDGFDTMRVPIGLIYKEGGSVTFSADIVPFPEGTKITLLDSLLGNVTELVNSSSTYTTTVAPNTNGIGRFFLNIIAAEVIEPTNLLDINGNKKLINIYTQLREIVVKGNVPEKTSATLYDVAGRPIRLYNLLPIEINILPADGIPTGIYLLKVYGSGVYEVKKVFLR